MMIHIIKANRKWAIVGIFVSVVLLFSSCKKFVDIGKAPDQLLVSDAFKEDATATSAVLALYSNSSTTSCIDYFSFAGDLEADVLKNAFESDPSLTEFENATVLPSNTTVYNDLWSAPYSVIGEANVAINGLKASTTLTPTLKNQLLGECKFFRAFSYFYLVNYFGGVPLSLSGDAHKDAYLPRASVDSIWASIISDLKDAQQLLTVTYVGNLRTRVNKYAATALLARAYLYTKDYTDAEIQASAVIDATDISYTLPEVESAFLNTSNGVIFQIATTGASGNLPELGTYYVSYNQFVLSPEFAGSFEAGDKRATAWTDGNTITKYKLSGNEYNIVLRLAEQYLIRAEARARLNKIADAQDDLNAVRSRAGLGNTGATTQEELLNAILQERKVEFFGEFSHRWFDLIRFGQAGNVIGALKPGWKSTAVLQPIPSIEITRNSALVQNPGYPQ
jgi:starch-binding outer membrane protein, SusD/RagB family